MTVFMYYIIYTSINNNRTSTISKSSYKFIFSMVCFHDEHCSDVSTFQIYIINYKCQIEGKREMIGTKLRRMKRENREQGERTRSRRRQHRGVSCSFLALHFLLRWRQKLNMHQLSCSHILIHDIKVG